MLSTLKERYQNIRLPEWGAPLALLFAVLLSFGLLAPFLGYYWDDWPPHLVARLYGLSSYWDYYRLDRPLSAWSYVIFSALLGATPWKWHVLTLILRWLASVGLWRVLRLLFPQRRRPALMAALLFAVYPAFTQQSIAVTYHQAWLEYVLYFASLGCAIQAIRKPQKTWLYSILSLLTLALNLSISEYFAGVELLRPVFLFLALNGIRPLGKRILQTLGRWLPYLLLLAAYVVWRLVFLKFESEDPNRPALLFTLLSDPAAALITLRTYVLQDSVYILFSSWYRALDPSLFKTLESFSLASWGIGLLAAAGCGWALLRLHADEDSPVNWPLAALCIGLPAVLLGPAPAWLIDRQASSGFNGDRYALTAMFGASLCWSAALEWLSDRPQRKVIALCVLIGLATALNLRTANDYRWKWVRQERFYWQLAWRAPSLQPATALFFETDPFPEQSLFSTSNAINLLYAQERPPEKLAYWVYTLRPRYDADLAPLLNGKGFGTRFRIFQFEGTIPDTLLLHYNPPAATCLWVLNPEDAADPDLPEMTRQALPIVSLERIQDVPPAPGYPPYEIFGEEPEHTWCWYYQKADLARQNRDWEGVVQLGDAARDLGYTPLQSESSTPHEWIPFIKGYAHQERWDDARQVTLDVYTRKGKRYTDFLCTAWRQALDETPASEARRAAAGEVFATLSCPH